jgi:hypothetical protein
MPSTSHPIALPGRRVVMSSPITSKVSTITTNGRFATRLEPPQSPEVSGFRRT